MFFVNLSPSKFVADLSRTLFYLFTWVLFASCLLLPAFPQRIVHTAQALDLPLFLPEVTLTNMDNVTKNQTEVIHNCNDTGQKETVWLFHAISPIWRKEVRPCDMNWLLQN